MLADNVLPDKTCLQIDNVAKLIDGMSTTKMMGPIGGIIVETISKKLTNIAQVNRAKG